MTTPNTAFKRAEIKKLEDIPLSRTADGGYNRPIDPGRALRLCFARNVLGYTLMAAAEAEGLVNHTTVLASVKKWERWASRQECYKQAKANHLATEAKPKRKRTNGSVHVADAF